MDAVLADMQELAGSGKLDKQDQKVLKSAIAVTTELRNDVSIIAILIGMLRVDQPQLGKLEQVFRHLDALQSSSQFTTLLTHSLKSNSLPDWTAGAMAKAGDVRRE